MHWLRRHLRRLRVHLARKRAETLRRRHDKHKRLELAVAEEAARREGKLRRLR